MQLKEDLEQFRKQSELLYGVFGDSVTNMFRDRPIAYNLLSPKCRESTSHQRADPRPI